jgi:hypothetical protein
MVVVLLEVDQSPAITAMLLVEANATGESGAFQVSRREFHSAIANFCV